MNPPLDYLGGNECFVVKARTLRSEPDLALRKNLIVTAWNNYVDGKSIVSFIASLCF